VPLFIRTEEIVIVLAERRTGGQRNVHVSALRYVHGHFPGPGVLRGHLRGRNLSVFPVHVVSHLVTALNPLLFVKSVGGLIRQLQTPVIIYLTAKQKPCKYTYTLQRGLRATVVLR